jgi:hypothetical protein
MGELPAPRGEDGIQKMKSGISLDEIVDSYWIFLARNHYRVHLDRFKRRLESDQKAAEAEAVVFCLLWSAKAHPDIFEDPGTGGPDFCCSPLAGGKYLVEVRSLDSMAVSSKSNLPQKLTGAGSGAYGLITDKLRAVVGSKAKQLANHGLPRVLAITCAYDFAGLLMDRGAARVLMTSASTYNVPIGESSLPPSVTTDLRDAVFCRLDKSDVSNWTVVPCRRSISAILLTQVYSRYTRIVGLLHPEPAVPFDPHGLPQVPYLRFKQWPFVEGRVETEWILGNDQDDSAVIQHSRIR